MDEIDFTSASHYRALAEHKLSGSRCKKCGNEYYPGQPMCPKCKSKDMEPYEYSGKGKLAAFSVISIATSAMIQAGYDRKNPYCAGVVKLIEGPSICAQIVGVDVSQPESIKIGTELSAVFLERGEGETKKTFLGFQP